MGIGLGWILLQKRHANILHISEKIFITNHQRDAIQTTMRYYLIQIWVARIKRIK